VAIVNSAAINMDVQVPLDNLFFSTTIHLQLEVHAAYLVPSNYPVNTTRNPTTLHCIFYLPLNWGRPEIGFYPSLVSEHVTEVILKYLLTIERPGGKERGDEGRKKEETDTVQEWGTVLLMNF
jgi:hypothetical protein